MSALMIDPQPLFEMADFFTEPNPDATHASMYPCGVHAEHREDLAHIADCWRSVCPSCGDTVGSSFDVTINHAGAERGLCTSMALRLNHLTYAIRYGEMPHERDLTVLALGWTIAPDGSQIPPTGHPRPHGWGHVYGDRDSFAAWVNSARARAS